MKHFNFLRNNCAQQPADALVQSHLHAVSHIFSFPSFPVQRLSWDPSQLELLDVCHGPGSFPRKSFSKPLNWHAATCIFFQLRPTLWQNRRWRWLDVTKARHPGWQMQQPKEKKNKSEAGEVLIMSGSFLSAGGAEDARGLGLDKISNH